MNESNNHVYYAARAEAARDSASRAKNSTIAAIHHDLAARYESLLAQLAQGTEPDPEGTQAD